MILTKVVPYDARSLKKLGCKLLHSWGGGSNPKCNNYYTFFFSILTASLIKDISHVVKAKVDSEIKTINFEGNGSKIFRPMCSQRVAIQLIEFYVPSLVNFFNLSKNII